MSSIRGPVLKFKHVEDAVCAEEFPPWGCEGHTIQCVRHLTSDMVYFLIDGEQDYTFDEGLLAAIVKAYEETE